MTKITVNTARPYDVTVGQGLDEAIVASVSDSVRKVLIVYSAPLAGRADALSSGLEARGFTPVRAEVPDAESGKTAEVLAFCWQVLGKSDFTRSDLVMGLGGGAVTDLAGFVAATWLRGIDVIQVPTTLLGMVDAAVGGKTGINTTEGKNLVGAFHEPLGVWCDTDRLTTLPRHDLVAGLAEVVKGGFIADARILELVEDNMGLLTATVQSGSRADASGDARALDSAAIPVLTELVARKVAVKANVVGADLKESFHREILNYGHTFGHAIEYTERYQWRHGAAVSVGMVFAAELARLAGKLSDADVDRHRSILGGLGLPTNYAPGRWEALYTAMKRDKKTRGDLLRFVVLHGLGNPQRLEGPDPSLLAAAYDAVSR
ncbi:3-dehydroquinate synthase [Demequina sp. TTPB684]|uniref:3-dehydroquinate synthase n=1 Tax=unclassified Demequina TaxID=2620311 RepID=UPI001CF47D4E|nr:MULTISPECIES: 3-dehydroquinate synthase [unclassified Demequina]MCB2411676.1 3-dehydroquinate synthase [Demequina sp. TTPB684]UPU89246.1 3-dehydroquinate synthase [Demequina sp. TMPB413]